MRNMRTVTFFHLQNKYKQSGKESMSSSLYAQLPETAQTQLAAKMSELQSEVRHHLLLKDSEAQAQPNTSPQLFI